MITKMETERLCSAVKEMAETVLKMAEISQMDEEWRKETASAIGLTAELAIRMIASASSGERRESEALFWASFLGGRGKSLLPVYWRRNAGRLLSWAEDGTDPDGGTPVFTDWKELSAAYPSSEWSGWAWTIDDLLSAPDDTIVVNCKSLCFVATKKLLTQMKEANETVLRKAGTDEKDA